MSKKLILPVTFDEDFDLVDGEGAPLLWGAVMIDHNPNIGREIEKRVNSHERLVESSQELADALDRVIGDYPTDSGEFRANDDKISKARALLAELESDHAQE